MRARSHHFNVHVDTWSYPSKLDAQAIYPDVSDVALASYVEVTLESRVIRRPLTTRPTPSAVSEL